MFIKMIPFVKTVTQLKLVNSSVVETTLPEIAEADALTFVIFFKQLMVMIFREVHQDIQAVALCLFRQPLRAKRLLLNINSILSRQITQSFKVAHALMFHNKCYGVATFSAAKVLEDAFRRHHIKGSGFLVCEWT